MKTIRLIIEGDSGRKYGIKYEVREGENLSECMKICNIAVLKKIWQEEPGGRKAIVPFKQIRKPKTMQVGEDCFVLGLGKAIVKEIDKSKKQVTVDLSDAALHALAITMLCNDLFSSPWQDEMTVSEIKEGEVC